MIKMKLKNKYEFSCTSAIGRASRIIALRDPALLCLDLYREASLCPYRLNTASSMRERNLVIFMAIKSI